MNKYIAHAEATFIDIGAGEIGVITDHIKDLIADFMPLLTLIFGVMIAMLVIGLLVKFVGGNNTS